MEILGAKQCNLYSNGIVVMDRILADADCCKNLEEKLDQF